MSTILPHVTVVVGNEEDARDVLGIEAAGTSVEEGKINAAAYAEVARKVVDRFPNVEKVGFTLRGSISADYNTWGGMLYDAATGAAHFAPEDSTGEYRPYEIRDIVDRVGGGDSFSAGLLHAMRSEAYRAPADALRFAVAASCLKHSIQGDFNYVGEEEVVALMRGSGSGRVRR
jgi:2-dehydro-3-deoxygluconokinase